MKKLLIFVVPPIIAGCASQISLPTPPPPPSPSPEKCITIPGKGCQKISAGNVGGTTLGHSEDTDLPVKASSP